MGDPRQTFHLPVEGEPAIRFTNTAIALAERSTGKTTPELYAHFAAGMFGFDLLNRVCRAGLEGARLKNRTGGKEWKLADVESLIEDAVEDGATFDQVAEVVVEAFNAALARWFPKEDDEASEDPPTAAGDGTTSFEPPSEQD